MTPEQTTKLAALLSAVDQVLDDMRDGCCCCPAAKAQLVAAFEAMSSHEEDTNICGLCGEPGADKMAMHTGGGVYWPGERIPDGDMVHQSCEQAETQRAHALLSQAQRDAVLRSASGGRWP